MFIQLICILARSFVYLHSIIRGGESIDTTKKHFNSTDAGPLTKISGFSIDFSIPEIQKAYQKKYKRKKDIMSLFLVTKYTYLR